MGAGGAAMGGHLVMDLGYEWVIALEDRNQIFFF